MKTKKQTISSHSEGSENSDQNDMNNSLSRRSFMKQSMAASAGVVAAPVMIAPAFQKTTVRACP